MKLDEYKKYFLTGDWHTHSTFSDGRNLPEEIVETAINLGLQLIAITDHVNIETGWLDDFVLEISRLKRKYGNKIMILSGIETKIVDLNGSVDARPDFFDKVDIVLAAFHRVPTDNDFMHKEDISKRKGKALEYWHIAMLSVLKNPNVDIIAHPTNLLLIHGIAIPFAMKKEIAKAANKNGLIFEMNIKYKVPDEEFIRLLEENNVAMVRGSDAHNVEEMKEIHGKLK